MSDEWFEDEDFEEYITDENDPQAVEKITEEDYTIPLDVMLINWQSGIFLTFNNYCHLFEVVFFIRVVT